ncbi:hypothetical protein [Ralstonia syzygii]|nr:hypothetical protein [Ralstonia syzygii]
MKSLGRIKGALFYWAAVAVVLAVHAYGLHLDEEGQADLRVRTAHKPA